MTHVDAKSIRSTSSKLTAIVLAMVAVTSIATTGFAQEVDRCVSVDREQDMLGTAEQKGAVALFQQELNKRGAVTVTEGCPSTIVLTHVRLGDSITVMAVGEGRHLDARVRSVNDLPAAYSQLAGALVGGTEVSKATDRNNVMQSQADPMRIKADSLIYFGLGYGMISAPQAQGGPDFEAGYRYELDWVAVDLSLDSSLFGLNENRGDNLDNQEGVAFGVNLDALYFFDPTADHSIYAGAGLGWTTAYLESGSRNWDGSGIAGRALVGYELLRSSDIRLMVAAQAVLPFYTLAGSNDGHDEMNGMPTDLGDHGERQWAPTFTTSLGIGWN